MNLFDQLTGHDMTRQQRAFQTKIDQLPADYQQTWQQINAQIWQFSDFSGRNLYPILEGLVDLFTESAAEGLTVTAVTGSDLTAFLTEVAHVTGASNYRDRLRQQLNQSIAKQLGK
ncbi:DUF1048 domain-containing protein [Lactiplantibacillus modestisalitolerans]|uniref:DUF1048 domain-containing protein n=1 Tax=Lactiplantibacillus modestisalitolerans TaxID=1457219 RepID=A0ABV5WV96_9LACO|nr:DUF1048 domain-containing protein [Lactiplantibacillus modestisalitolerans]